MNPADYHTLGLAPPPAEVAPPTGPDRVAGLVERAAAQVPDAEALTCGERRYTFSELARVVNAAAALFSKAGIGTGDRIAASLPNCCDIVIAFFAAMRIGAVWVGINTILPAQDKRFILDHSGARLLITDTQVAAQLGETHDAIPSLERVIVLDDPAHDGGWSSALSATANPEAPSPDVDPFAPAAIMYTSGTTGTPKGVVHSQHNMITVIAALKTFDPSQAPTFVHGAALPVTITNVMILGPIAAFWGMTAFKLAPSPKIRPLVEWLHQENINQISFVPAMIYDLLKEDLDLPKGLIVGSGGAPLPNVVREAFAKRYGYDVQGSYGLTEAPTVVANYRMRIAPEGASGLALPHLRLSIRDAEGNECAAGKVGEVCFRAVEDGPWANVYTPPLGYWLEPEKTASLLRDGFVHTGDHGSIDAEGWLTIADRSSELILRGGSNVYPAEIERILHAHPDVADCAVVGKPDLRMGMLTVAFILKARPDTEHAALEESLRALCGERLARYKVPDIFRFPDEFPRNAMGKVIRPRLRELLKAEEAAE